VIFLKLAQGLHLVFKLKSGLALKQSSSSQKMIPKTEDSLMQTPLMSTRRRKRLTIRQENGSTLISVGEMEIWDGADLALIRDTLFEQILDFEQRELVLDMKTVKYIPSGFFGMLGDWKDRGINISVLGVQPNVAQMLWFQQYFTELRPGYFQLEAEPNFLMENVFRDDEADATIEEETVDPMMAEEISTEVMTSGEWSDSTNLIEEAIAC
jgi:hypothetical protein